MKPEKKKGYCSFDYIHFAMHSNNQTLNDILNKIPGWRILKVIVNITFIVVVVVY